MTADMHEMTEACQHVHCAWHNLDEPAENPFRVCGECFHTYPTGRALRKAERRLFRQLLRSRFTDPALATWSYGLLVELWLVATVRVGRIWSCPYCAHDW